MLHPGHLFGTGMRSLRSTAALLRRATPPSYRTVPQPRGRRNGPHGRPPVARRGPGDAAGQPLADRCRRHARAGGDHPAGGRGRLSRPMRETAASHGVALATDVSSAFVDSRYVGVLDYDEIRAALLLPRPLEEGWVRERSGASRHFMIGPGPPRPMVVSCTTDSTQRINVPTHARALPWASRGD